MVIASIERVGLQNAHILTRNVGGEGNFLLVSSQLRAWTDHGPNRSREAVLRLVLVAVESEDIRRSTLTGNKLERRILGPAHGVSATELRQHHALHAGSLRRQHHAQVIPFAAQRDDLRLGERQRCGFGHGRLNFRLPSQWRLERLSASPIGDLPSGGELTEVPHARHGRSSRAAGGEQTRHLPRIRPPGNGLLRPRLRRPKPRLKRAPAQKDKRGEDDEKNEIQGVLFWLHIRFPWAAMDPRAMLMLPGEPAKKKRCKP